MNRQQRIAPSNASDERAKSSVLTVLAEAFGTDPNELEHDGCLEALEISSIVITAVIAELEITLRRALTMEESIALFGAMSSRELVDLIMSMVRVGSSDANRPSLHPQDGISRPSSS